MNWKTLIQDLRNAGMSQAAIGEAIGKSQGWVSAVMADGYSDLRWSDGEALRSLHAEKLGAGEMKCPAAGMAQPVKEAA